MDCEGEEARGVREPEVSMIEGARDVAGDGAVLSESRCLRSVSVEPRVCCCCCCWYCCCSAEVGSLSVSMV